MGFAPFCAQIVPAKAATIANTPNDFLLNKFMARLHGQIQSLVVLQGTFPT
jgi:hypothetical protein